MSDYFSNRQRHLDDLISGLKTIPCPSSYYSALINNVIGELETLSLKEGIEGKKSWYEFRLQELSQIKPTEYFDYTETLLVNLSVGAVSKLYFHYIRHLVSVNQFNRIDELLIHLDLTKWNQVIATNIINHTAYYKQHLPNWDNCLQKAIKEPKYNVILS